MEENASLARSLILSNYETVKDDGYYDQRSFRRKTMGRPFEGAP